jgi:hypothetical protein
MTQPHLHPRLRSRLLTVPLLLLCALIPGSATAAPGNKAGDARLKQPVTTRAVDEPLRTWLEQLSRETGVSLRTAADYEDRAITARAAGMPLGKLMGAVAALFGDVWVARVRKGQAPQYVLEASAARRGRQRQLLTTYQRLLQTALMDEARTTAEKGPRPESVEGVADSEAGRARVVAEWTARARLVSMLEPEAVGRLLSGGRLRLKVSDTEGPLGEALRRFVKEFATPAEDGVPQELRDERWVEFSARPYVLGRFAPGLTLRSVDWAVGSSSSMSSGYNLPVRAEEFQACLLRETAPLRRGEEQEPEERRQQAGEVLKRSLPQTIEPAGGTPAARSELLLAIADAADLSLISDSHTRPRPPSPSIRGRSVEEALTSVCDTHGSFWRMDQGAIAVRSRYWWLDDQYEPPAAAVARWERTLKEQGRLGLEEVCQMALLSLEQRQRLGFRLPEAGTVNNPWLQFYARLTAAQRTAAGSERGLLLEAVPRPVRLKPAEGSDQLGAQFGSLELEETLQHDSTVIKVAHSPANERPALTFIVQPPPGQFRGRLRLRRRVTVPLPFRDPRVKPGPPVIVDVIR